MNKFIKTMRDGINSVQHRIRRSRSRHADLLLLAAAALSAMYLTSLQWAVSASLWLTVNPWAVEILLVAAVGALAVVFLPAVWAGWAGSLLLWGGERWRQR